MDYQKFIQQLPEYYEDWGKESVHPKSSQFQTLLERVQGMTTVNVLQLLNWAVDCMQSGEVYCEIGCFQGASLIGALLNHSHSTAYAVDNFSRFDSQGENFDVLNQNITEFGLEEKVIFCNQDFEEFFWELREVEFNDKIGVYFYDGAHDYRSQLLGLLLVKPFLANQALIIVDDSNRRAVHQANWDFIASHPQCRMLLDLPTQKDGDRTFWNGIQILSWDINDNYSYDSQIFRLNRKESIIKSIYDLQFVSNREILESIREEALELQNQELYDQAITKYQQVIRWNDHDFYALLNLGCIYCIRGCYPEALTMLLKSIEIDPSQAIAYYNLGIVHESLENLNLATAAYEQAIFLDAGQVDAYNNLGNILYKQFKFEEAEKIYRQAIQVNPQHYGSYLNLGNTLIARNQIVEAIEVYQAALKINPEQPDLLANLKIAEKYQEQPESFYQFYLTSSHFVEMKRVKEAVLILEQGIAQYPNDINLHYQLVQLLLNCGRIEEAIAKLQAALSLIPDSIVLQVQQLQLLPVIYKTDEEIDLYRYRYANALQNLIESTQFNTKEERQAALDAIGRKTNFYLAYQGKNDLELQKQYGQLVTSIMSGNYPQWMQKQTVSTVKPTEKIRIGYISFRLEHSRLGQLIVGWLRYHDRQKFEIYCYYLDENIDAVKEFEERSDEFYHIPRDFTKACQQILDDELHILILVDMGIHPEMTQLGSLRLAPIQCTTWAHPVTSGLANIDYFLSSELMEPENGDLHYSETLIRLPNIGICYAKPQLPVLDKTRENFGLDEDQIVYLSCQSLFKYLPQHDYLFVEIALQVPQAQFVFISHKVDEITAKFQQRLAEAFQSRGLTYTDYCVILPQLKETDYLKLNLLSDIFLDSLGWSGGVTTLKAIACHLPVVTCPGELMRGRHSYGILKMLGVNDTIAETELEYIRIAVKLGLDRNWRRNRVECIVQNQNYLYEDITCIKALEEFYQKVYESHSKK